MAVRLRIPQRFLVRVQAGGLVRSNVRVNDVRIRECGYNDVVGVFQSERIIPDAHYLQHGQRVRAVMDTSLVLGRL